MKLRQGGTPYFWQEVFKSCNILSIDTGHKSNRNCHVQKITTAEEGKCCSKVICDDRYIFSTADYNLITEVQSSRVNHPKSTTAAMVDHNISINKPYPLISLCSYKKTLQMLKTLHFHLFDLASSSSYNSMNKVQKDFVMWCSNKTWNNCQQICGTRSILVQNPFYTK